VWRCVPSLVARRAHMVLGGWGGPDLEMIPGVRGQAAGGVVKGVEVASSKDDAPELIWR
jgi:hypothetical protein